MGGRSEILVLDYENSLPKMFDNLFTQGYRMKVVRENSEAILLAKGVDLIIMLVTKRRRECIKLMEHIKRSIDPSINFILILSGGEDRIFQERIDGLVFQCFKKYRFSSLSLSKAIQNAIEMKNLKSKEKRFIKDLDKIEDELRQVENRLFTISRLKNALQRGKPRFN